MKRTLAVSLFVLATFTWTFAQTSGSSSSSSQQPPAASSQSPDASHSQAPSGSAGQSSSQSGAQAGSQSQAANAPITEGCLGGSNGNYTLTDKAGTSYKLTFPANANVSVLSSHVGESVAVMGDTQGDAKAGQTINVSKIGRGTTSCPGSSNSSAPTGSTPPPQTPKQ